MSNENPNENPNQDPNKDPDPNQDPNPNKDPDPANTDPDPVVEDSLIAKAASGELPEDFFNEDKTFNEDKVKELFKSEQSEKARADGLRQKLSKGVEKAPETIEGYEMPEELKDALPADDAVLTAFKEASLKLGYGNDMFQAIINEVLPKLEIEGEMTPEQIADQDKQIVALEEKRQEEEMAKLGEDGPKIVYAIEQFGIQQVEKGLMTKEESIELNAMITTSEGVRVVHNLISRLGETPLPNIPSVSGMETKAEYEALIMATDENGEAKMRNKAYAAEMEAKGQKLKAAGII